MGWDGTPVSAGDPCKAVDALALHLRPANTTPPTHDEREDTFVTQTTELKLSKLIFCAEQSPTWAYYVCNCSLALRLDERRKRKNSPL